MALDWEGHGARVLVPSLLPADVRLWASPFPSLELSYVMVQ